MNHSDAKKALPSCDVPPKVILEVVGWGLCLITLFCIPILVVANDPNAWNALGQISFQLITSIISIAIGYRLSKATSYQQATRKWLPPAQNACNHLQIIKAQVSRLRTNKRTTCDELQDLISGVNDEQRVVIEKLVRIKCESCKSRLLDVEQHLLSSYESWLIFIRENCASQCKTIVSEVERFASALSTDDDA